MVRPWDATTGRRRGEPFAHRGPTRFAVAAVGPDAKTVLLGGLVCEVAGGEMPTSQKHILGIRSIHFGLDGEIALVALYESSRKRGILGPAA